MKARFLLPPLLLPILLLSACQSAAPAPPTPGALEPEIVELAETMGLAGRRFLGLESTAWINLGISLLIIFAGYLLGFWVMKWVESWVSRRVKFALNQEARRALSTSIRWLIMIGALYLATSRLTFLSPPLKRTLLDIYFIIAIGFLAVLLWHVIDWISTIYLQRKTDNQRSDLEPVIVFATRSARVLMLAGLMAWLLSHFGINVAALTAAVGLGGLAISLAARDTIADLIAGIIILVDRPFRVGDRIEIEKANTWGDVTDIGLRTTRIRTRDNRLVIIPNSMIASNEIINYTYPDPRYRIQTRLHIAYGSDIEAVRQIIIDTVKGVDGILTDLPVEALYEEMADWAMVFMVRWWIDSYVDFRRALDKVNTALQVALDQHGIVGPYPTSTVILRDESPAGAPSANNIGP